MQIENSSLAELSNEALADLLYANETNQIALQQLIWKNRRTMIKLGNKYLSDIPIYDIDDYVQEGAILIWKIISERKFTSGSNFNALFYKSFENKCITIYRNYVLHNLIVVSEYDYDGEIHSILVEADYAKKYREKHREECRRWYEKNRKETDKEPRPKLTVEEKKERNRQRAREYYRTHKEQCIEAKRKWYRENREYALKYQKDYNSRKRSSEEK
jgi:hypothetical protein